MLFNVGPEVSSKEFFCSDLTLKTMASFANLSVSKLTESIQLLLQNNMPTYGSESVIHGKKLSITLSNYAFQGKVLIKEVL